MSAQQPFFRSKGHVLDTPDILGTLRPYRVSHITLLREHLQKLQPLETSTGKELSDFGGERSLLSIVACEDRARHGYSTLAIINRGGIRPRHGL
jgi:hypothetical protein